MPPILDYSPPATPNRNRVWYAVKGTFIAVPALLAFAFAVYGGPLVPTGLVWLMQWFDYLSPPMRRIGLPEVLFFWMYLGFWSALVGGPLGWFREQIRAVHVIAVLGGVAAVALCLGVCGLPGYSEDYVLRRHLWIDPDYWFGTVIFWGLATLITAGIAYIREWKNRVRNRDAWD